MPVVNRDGKVWTHDEVVFALGLYFQVPWGNIYQRNPVRDHLAHDAFNAHFAFPVGMLIDFPTRGRLAAEFLNYHNEYAFVA